MPWSVPSAGKGVSMVLLHISVIFPVFYQFYVVYWYLFIYLFM
uniref:Uncharacterized protein n=1 Tax=Anguilla anguilla TaxID=7936 RepID=A0A0E9SXN9_ANGAN